MAYNQAVMILRWTIVILACLAGNARADGIKLAPAVPPLTCPTNHFVIDGACLRVIKTTKTHRIAQEEVCKALNKNVVAAIDTQAKNDWVQQELGYHQVTHATIDAEARGKKVAHANKRPADFLIRDWSNFANESRNEYHQHFALRASDGKWVQITRANPVHAVVCEQPTSYPAGWCPSRVPYADHSTQFAAHLTQGVCFLVRNVYEQSGFLSSRVADNVRSFKSGKGQCLHDNYYVARIDSPEKNALARRLINNETKKADGYFDYQWSFVKTFPHMWPQTYTNWAPGEPKKGNPCAVVRHSDGKWITSDCNKKYLPICQYNRPPRCYMPLHILHANIRVTDAYQKIIVTCHPGMRRIGPSGVLNCTNTRYGDYFPAVRCVPLSGKTYAKYIDKTACKNRFLAFPLTPGSSAPSFEYANATCRKVYMDIPRDNDIGCVQAFIAKKRSDPQYANFAAGYTGPWVYVSYRRPDTYRWLDRDGNTRGYNKSTELNYKNRVICVGVMPYPDLGGADKVFENKTHCPGMTVRFPKGVVPNTNIPAFKIANDTCYRAGMRVPATHALPCLRKFLEHLENDPRFVNFVSNHTGVWVYLQGNAKTPYAWMDKHGMTRGYTDSTTRHINNHVVCIQAKPNGHLQVQGKTLSDQAICQGTVLDFASKTNPNAAITTFKRADEACQKAYMTLPDERSAACLQAFVKKLHFDARFPDFVTDHNGPWIYLRDAAYTPYRWMDANGKTRGFKTNTAIHANNRVICVRTLAVVRVGQDVSNAASGSSLSTPAIAGAVGGAVAVGLVIVGYLYRNSVASGLKGVSMHFGKKEASVGQIQSGFGAKRG